MNEFLPVGEQGTSTLTKQWWGDGYSFRSLLTIGKIKSVTLTLYVAHLILWFALSLEEKLCSCVAF